MKIKETIIVEGTYDKIKLGQIVDAPIITTGGFSIFKDKAKMQLIRNIALKTGIVVLTDSDRAGFMIRNYIKQCVPAEYVKHAYIPEIKGVEKRKRLPGKEGLLGVEGISDALIRESLINAGCRIEDQVPKEQKGRKITKMDLFEDGLLGKKNSSTLRKKLTDKLGLPSRLSSNSLLEVLNILYTYEQYKEVIKGLK
ncbi:MAG: DUF4093 domain-containing protein [Clostridiaceae bacterium]|nr:DUF4093 domain-containing protein [Clostridiaceae bacterium]